MYDLTKRVMISMSEENHKFLKKNAKKNGFPTIAAWGRYLFEKDIERKRKAGWR